jgi:phosphatidylserine/phosphatidylglycerophosphate/cardiolipin synthase-like enzyme
MDGEVAFTGGVAVADKWLGDAEQPDHWRDTMSRFTGPPASTIQTAFVSLWAPVAGELPERPRVLSTARREARRRRDGPRRNRQLPFER